MFKKLIMLGVAVVMLFSVLAFAGCNQNEELLRQIQEMWEKLENTEKELQTQIDELRTQVEMLELTMHQNSALRALSEYVAGLNEDDFFKSNWKRIEDYASSGKTAINVAKSKSAVDVALSEAKQNINAVPWIVTADDFELTISMENTTIEQGGGWEGGFYVNVEFKNISGQGMEIFFVRGFEEHIPGVTDVCDPNNPRPSDSPTPPPRFLENNGIWRNNNMMVAYRPGGLFVSSRGLSVGKHELSFAFLFNVYGHTICFPEKNIIIRSNIIILTVI